MNAPVSPQKPMVSIATDTNKRMGFNNFVKDIQGVMPIQPMMAPQMPPPMPQQAMVPQVPAMPASSQSIRGGIGMPPVQGFDNGGKVDLTKQQSYADISDLDINNDGTITLAERGATGYDAGTGTYIFEAGPPIPDNYVAPSEALTNVMVGDNPEIDAALTGAGYTAQDDGTYVDPSGIMATYAAGSGPPTNLQAQTTSVAPATFSTGSPIPMADPNAGDVVGGIDFLPGLPPEEDPVSTLTPIQQAAQALQNKIDEVGVSTFSRESDDDRAIRFADGTNLLDKDILAEFGVGRNEFLDAIDDLGVGRGNLFRTSRGGSTGAFQTGLENILLSPEERAIAEQEYKDSAAEAARLKRKEDRQFEQDQADRAARVAGTDPLSKEVARLNEKLGTNMSVSDYVNNYNFVDRAKMAAEDLASRPGRLMDDLFKLGSRDDTPSAPPTQFSDANLNAMSDALGMEAFDALSGDERVTPFSDPMYGEQGRGFFPPDTEITQSNLPSAGTADPSSGVLPSSDLGRLLSGDPQIVDDVIKLLAIDPEKTKSDLLSTATTTLGPDRLREADTAPTITSDLGISLGDSGFVGGLPNISGIGDAPVIDRMGYYDGSDERILGYDLNYENQLRDRDLDVLRRDLDVLRGDQVDLSGLPRTPQSFDASDTLRFMAGDEGPIENEQDLKIMYDNYGVSQGGDLNRLGPENFAPYPEQSSDPYTSTEVIKDLAKQVASAGIESAALKAQGTGDLLDRQINEANSPAGIAESIYGGNFPTRFGQGSLNVMSGYDPYEVDPSIINALRGTDLQVPGSGLFGGDFGTMGYSGVRDLGSSQQDAEYRPTTAAADFMKDTVGTDALLDLSKRIEGSVSEQGQEESANNIITGDIVKKEYTIPESVPFIGGEKVSGLGVDNFSWGDNPSLVGTALQVARGAGDFIVDAPLYFAGLPGMAIALGSNVSEASAASANSIANQVENLFNSGEIENLQAYKDDIAITGDADLTKQRLAANAKESILRTGLVEGTFETLAGGLAAKPTAVLNTLFKGTLNKPVKATAVAVGSPTGEATSELLGNISENVGFQVIDPMVEPGRGGVASFGAGFKEGMSPGVIGAGTSLLSSSQPPSGPTTVAGDPRVELQEELAKAETELQNEIDNLSKGEEISLSKEALENAGLDPELIDPVLREAGVIENPSDQISSLNPIDPNMTQEQRVKTMFGDNMGFNSDGRLVFNSGSRTGEGVNFNIGGISYVDGIAQPPTMESLEEEYLKASQEGNTDKMIEALTLRQDAQVNAPKTGVRFEQTDPDGGFEQNVNVPYSTNEDLNNYLREKHSSSRTSQSKINTGSDINNELENLANDETNTKSDGDNEAQVLSDASSTTDITNIVNTGTTTDTTTDTTPVIDPVIDPVIEIVNQTNPPAKEDPVVVESEPPISVPPSGDSDTAKSKQERRDYSRMREILEQRARAPRGTAPGLGYKPVEAISNTLGKDSNNFDTLLGMTRSQGFNQGGPVPSTLDKAADDFLDALRFG
jgi:hypothetical protein